MTKAQDPDSAPQRASNRIDAKWQGVKDGVAQRNAAAHAEAKKKRVAADAIKRIARQKEDR